MPDKLAIIFIISAALVLVIFLIWKNIKDKRAMNPGAQDSLEEKIMDRERDRDKI
jgi:hypothetical protein